MAALGRIDLASLEPVGRDLHRPECVLTNARGEFFVSDWRGGVTQVLPSGDQQTFLATGGLAASAGFQVLPNGITLMPDGSFLLCHLGAETGGVFQLYRDGRLEPFLTELDGEPLPPTNYAHLDAQGRVWVTVSTRKVPRAAAYRGDVADGYVILKDGAGARVVADNLGYTNECLLHPDGKRLFVNETFARRLSSFDVAADGSLSGKRVVAEFEGVTFPDGMAFDVEGGVWVTSIVSNRLVRVSPDGAQEVVLEDADPEHLKWVEAAFLKGEMGRPHLDGIKSQYLRSVSSLAFGGPDLRTIYLGCLLGDHLFRVKSPVAGHPPVHWNF